MYTPGVYISEDMTMVRTQIYLTECQRDELAAIAGHAGKGQSELIREAVDRYIEVTSLDRRKASLREAAGLWSERTDLPDYGAIRADWDRS